MPVAERDDPPTEIDERRQRTPSPADNREVYVADEGLVSFAIHHAGDLGAGAIIDGPAIVQEPTTTVLLMSGDRLNVKADRSYLIDIGVN